MKLDEHKCRRCGRRWTEIGHRRPTLCSRCELVHDMATQPEYPEPRIAKGDSAT